MSYILDALKKLENEKARKLKTPGTISIAGELFSDNHTVNHGNNGRMAALAILVTVLLTFGLTWYFLKGKGNNTVTAVPAPLQSTAPVNPAPAPIPQPLQQVVAPQQEPNVPAVPEQQKIVHSVVKQKTERTFSSPRVQESKKTVLQLASPPADIQVSGVAWQDERGLRRAVVNGFLLKEGATISGAQLKEILPDRVRFERSGTQFEVPFVSSSTQAGR